MYGGFMPAQKLKSKTRAGSKETRVYDELLSPFRRLLECAQLPREYKEPLQAQCALYNAVELQLNVNKAVLRASTACPDKPHSDARAG
jgi:hypothetical protein